MARWFDGVEEGSARIRAYIFETLGSTMSWERIWEPRKPVAPVRICKCQFGCRKIKEDIDLLPR